MSSDDFHHRIALLAVVQFVLIVGGWIALATVMKFEGYPDDNPVVRFKPMPVVLREYGAWALLIPVLYAVAACMAGESPDSKLERSGHVISLICLAASFVLLLAFLISAASPYTRGLWVKYV